MRSNNQLQQELNAILEAEKEILADGDIVRIAWLNALKATVESGHSIKELPFFQKKRHSKLEQTA